MNKAGTTLLVVGREHASRRSLAKSVQTILGNRNMEFAELKGKERRAAQREFLSGSDWYRASDVNKLSEQEAGILAARLVRRIQAKVSVSEAKAETLRAEITDVFKQRFTGSQNNDEPNVETRLLNVLRRHLDEKDVAVLKETLPPNLRPLPGEK
ncbi:MAG: hypothetical protein HY735_01710 [Verrucomicrobia bacterium]|nr:hypothetical protein [Verrucomicrobiota bacterium]